MSNHGPDSDQAQLLDNDTLPTDPAELALAQQEASLRIVHDLRHPDSEWQEVRAYGYLSDSAKKHSLTATTLRQPGSIHRRPLKFFNNDKTECILIAHLGQHLCGHDGIIHGGLLATLLDEHLAYVTLPKLPNYTGFTANLNVDYRRPVKSNQWVIVRGKLDRVEGRKAWADAWVEHIEDGTKFTEARALYISPRT
ncbi:HotDog domain-containing protein [Absidia repens]|uniref:HotDog domain-containing protein n=1 Tax=Absidia repens TaxID=90262 RepID=A0A1X2IET9_9FUNG|nr:HotDog domain-containing protein [Absidia repens]